MMILLTKKEYNDLVSKASGIEAQAEIKFEEYKEQFSKRLEKFIRDNKVDWRTGPELLGALKEVLKQYK